jgi:type I restriction-modification system DNA methylase subunit/signal transduction histidine kinase
MVKLHEAIYQVLSESGKPLAAREIAEQINRQSLYMRNDGGPVPASQISARVNKYPALFTKKDKLIDIKNNSTKPTSFLQDLGDFAKIRSFQDNPNYGLKLHEAIDLVLKNNKRPMTASDIAREINSKNLYQRNDGMSVPSSQIHARVNNYGHLFFKTEDGLIQRLKPYNLDLIDVAMDLQSKLSNFWNQSGSRPNQAHLIVPFIFFCRRLLDNPDLLSKHIDSHIISNEFTRENFITLLVSIQESENELNSLSQLALVLEQVLPEIEMFLFNPDFLPDGLQQASISTSEFGVFFNKLIHKLAKQNNYEGEFATPESLNALIVDLLSHKLVAGNILYNPATGFATIPGLLAQNNRHFNFQGEEISVDVFLIGLMNLIVNKIPIDHFKNESAFNEHLSMPADVAVCVPPVIGQNSNVTILLPVQTDELVLQFIQKCILSLKSDGLAIILVPENVLFSTKKDFFALRQYLIDNRLIESVISLPANLLSPITGIKTSLLILSNKQNTAINFIDAEEYQLTALASNSEQMMAVKKISEAYFGFEHENEASLREDQAVYGNQKKIETAYESLNTDNLNLLPKRNLLTSFDLAQFNATLQDITDNEFRGRPAREDEMLPMVNIGDLNMDHTHYFLNLTNLQPQQGKTNFRVIDQPALLIGKLPDYPKPTYFKGGQEIMISGNIHLLKIDTTKVLPEYLIQQLVTDSTARQLNALATGATTLRKVSRNDILNLKFLLPPIDQQQVAISSQKQKASHQTLNESGEKLFLSFFRHEIGNIIGGVSNDIDNLKKFLINYPIPLTEKLTKTPKSKTLEDVFCRLNRNIKDIDNVGETLKLILEVKDTKPSITLLDFRSFMLDFCGQIPELKKHNIEVLLGTNGKYDDNTTLSFNFDLQQLKFMVRNLIINAIKHGFDGVAGEKMLLFNLETDSEYFYLNVLNNGKPLPDNFTINDFASFGKRSDNSKGSGLGGYLIKSIAENHQGELHLFNQKNSVYAKPLKQNPIKINVHFQIKWPKEQL